ncbi:MAG: GNAT family N-acetyltransferase [Chloroflexi bacterium]|nr:GNAT family N-acetyltransferase [Chloroflexota bacterium]
MTETLSITIRGQNTDDWENIVEILAGENVVANTLQLPYQSRDTIQDRVENPPANARMLVAEVDGTVIGLLGLHLHQGRQAHATELGMMVHPDFQGQGVGSALLEAAIDLAENWLNISRIELTVFTDNADGVALYHKFGFEIEGTLHDYAFRAGEYVDAYLMARLREESRT